MGELGGREGSVSGKRSVAAFRMPLLHRLCLTRTSSYLKCIGGKPRPYYTRAWRANREYSGVSTKEEGSSARQLVQQRRRRLHQAVEGHIVGNAEVFPSLQHLLGNLFHGANKDGRHLQNLLN